MEVERISPIGLTPASFLRSSLSGSSFGRVGRAGSTTGSASAASLAARGSSSASLPDRKRQPNGQRSWLRLRHPSRFAGQPFLHLALRPGHAHRPVKKPLVAREADKREQARPGEPEWHAVIELPVEPGAGAFVLWKRHTLTSSFNSPVLSAKAAHSTPARFSMVTNRFVMGT